jgi:hypothetical protein
MQSSETVPKHAKTPTNTPPLRSGYSTGQGSCAATQPKLLRNHMYKRYAHVRAAKGEHRQNDDDTEQPGQTETFRAFSTQSTAGRLSQSEYHNSKGITTEKGTDDMQTTTPRSQTGSAKSVWRYFGAWHLGYERKIPSDFAKQAGMIPT